MGMPAARIGDMHVCPMVTGVVPHVGGPVLPPCAVTVLTGSIPQARVGDMCTCVGPPDVIVVGAFTVLVSGSPAARMLDTTAHGGKIVIGLPTVLIGNNGGGGGAGAGAAAPLTPKQITTLQARNEALQMLDKTVEDLETWDDATKARAQKWFGSSDDAVRDKMLDRAKKARDKLAGFGPDNFVAAEAGQEDCYAYVYPNDDTKIYLGNDFDGAPLTGANSKAGTLIHETSHYNSVGGTDDEELADGTTAYGHSAAQKLAQENPEKAQNNADSFEYFVENQ
jgi:uncharacterized Zn-binding protein involved in type VI secretion